jgi:hypothetical protein
VKTFFQDLSGAKIPDPMIPGTVVNLDDDAGVEMSRLTAENPDT